MGVTRLLLATRRLSARCVFYTDSLRVDFAETFHLHYRQVRLSLAPRELGPVTWALVRAWLGWRWRGRPHHRAPDDVLVVAQTSIPVLEGEDFTRARGDELSIELQQQADYVHLHYRALRLELSISEFRILAEACAEALFRLQRQQAFAPSPERVGTHHGTNPHGRVLEGPTYGYWTTETPPTATSIIRDGEAWRAQLPWQDLP